MSAAGAAFISGVHDIANVSITNGMKNPMPNVAPAVAYDSMLGRIAESGSEDAAGRTDAALCNADRVTLAGAMMPIGIISP